MSRDPELQHVTRNALDDEVMDGDDALPDPVQKFLAAQELAAGLGSEAAGKEFTAESQARDRAVSAVYQKLADKTALQSQSRASVPADLLKHFPKLNDD